MPTFNEMSRHQTARAYARILEIMGYAIAVLGAISGIATMFQVSFTAGLGYLFGAVATGIGLVVLGEIVIVLFNIEANTSRLRESLAGRGAAPPEPSADRGVIRPESRPSSPPP